MEVKKMTLAFDRVEKQAKIGDLVQLKNKGRIFKVDFVYESDGSVVISNQFTKERTIKKLNQYYTQVKMTNMPL
jgi:hypothetical protein